MTKLRIKVEAVIEYDADPTTYPEDKRTPKGMLEVDLANAEDDVFSLLDGDKVQWAIAGEVVS